MLTLAAVTRGGVHMCGRKGWNPLNAHHRSGAHEAGQELAYAAFISRKYDELTPRLNSSNGLHEAN